MNEETGKSIKLLRHDLSEIQNIVAEQLNLERGQSSDKKHLCAMEFKAQKKAEEALLMDEKRKKAKQDYKITKVKHGAENISHGIAKGVSEVFKRIGGVHEAKQLKNALNAEQQCSKDEFDEKMELKKELQDSVSLDKYNQIQEAFFGMKSEVEQLKSLLKSNQHRQKTMKTRVAKIYSGLDKDGEAQSLLRESVKDEMTKLIQEEKNKERSQNRGLSM